ncbi:DUF2948 family protein [Rubrimonas cliftonensis]|uniref:DUF2948 family protein n=1 Tax=Rubrimonas cliftonensis TaxID=89524 RepID=A0A1H3VF20_9RHOB|nr:DUF2948 family protein [Rubrimonas cliftonensis]SDZ73251.1 Protein of unknown function [Rubrimonas cliftonensis]
MADARFEDADRPLRIRAETAEGLPVLAALAQDAVGAVGDARFLPRARRFAALISRFRWEDAEAAKAAGRPYERVRAMLVVENVLAARARGLSPAASDAVYNLLSMSFEPAEDGAGELRLALSGGADIVLDVEALEVSLSDVARPHAARGLPEHPAEDGAAQAD